MSKQQAIIILGVLLIVSGLWWVLGRAPEEAIMGVGYKDATYSVEGVSITLVNGTAATEITPGGASKITTTYFGNEARADFNSDGLEDIAFLLTQNSGGSGTFYYAVVALRNEFGYRGSNAILLGDRIAPQTTEARDGVLIVNYADRAEGEPMTVRPSYGKSLYLRVEDGALRIMER